MFWASQPTEILIISTSEFDDNTFSKCESGCLRSQNIQFDGQYGMWREREKRNDLMDQTDARNSVLGLTVKTLIASSTHFSHPLSSLAAEKSSLPLCHIPGIPFIWSGGLGTPQRFAPCKFSQMTNDWMSLSPHQTDWEPLKFTLSSGHFRFTSW